MPLPGTPIQFVRQARSEAESYLVAHILPGQTIYVVKRHQSMSRSGNSTYWYDAYIIVDGDIRRITRQIVTACDLAYSDKYECLQSGHPARDILPRYLASVLWPHASANKPLIVEEL